MKLDSLNRQLIVLAAVLIGAGANLVSSLAGAPLGLAEGEVLEDVRQGPLKDLDGYFPFKVPASPAEWSERATAVRQRILVSQGLWPMPEKTPLNAVVHGQINLGDYSVEKVYFESFPGFFVTGNLYRPIGYQGKRPGVLSPHGHWSDGRFTDNQNIRSEIVAGAERFENGGRSVLQSRCVQLARMGCVVFHYDMIGYADSVQISYELAHRFARQRPHMNRPKDWGLFSPQAESHLQSVMGLQSWNSIRALDFLESLPEVDSARLAATGASGGGTQTFILGAIEPRLAAVFPAVMVCTAMQGGCTCENASLLRIGTGNVEIAGLFAPKPMGLTGADDWTVEMSTKGFPELKALYRMLGNESGVKLTALNHFGHNFNYVSRAAMYDWFNQHLSLGHETPIVEEDYPRLSRADLTVWNDAHPEPEKGEAFERRLLAYWHDSSRSELEEASRSPDAFKRLVGPAVKAIVGRSFASSGDIEWAINEKNDHDSYLEMSGVLKNGRHKEAVPVVFLYPKDWRGGSVLWLHEKGKDGLYDDDGSPIAAVVRLLKRGITVVGCDLFFQGESLKNQQWASKTRRVKNPRESAAYTFGYNHSVFAQRVHDVLSVVRFMKTHEEESEWIGMIALEGAGHWASVARSVLGSTVDRYAIDTAGFRFGGIDDLHHPDFLPGGAKYLDLPGFLLLGANTSLWLKGESRDQTANLSRFYREAGKGRDLEIVSGDPAETSTSSAVDWMLR